MGIDAIARHVMVADPAWFNPRSVDIFGVGAVGLTVALQLAKLGIEQMRIVDFDTVEQANLGPSLYGWPEVGLRKTHACMQLLARDTRMTPAWLDTNAASVDTFGNVVCLCLDSNDLKKEIVSRCASIPSGFPTWMLEARMSERYLMAHSFDPRNELHVEAWGAYTPPDAEVDSARACGGEPISIGPVAMLAASLLSQLFIDYLQARTEKPAGLTNQVYVDLKTYHMESARWD